MNNLFNVINVDDYKKIGTLKAEAQSKVKSTKYFPIYSNENNEYLVFKPLSKTKPLTTPLFAYSEVYWSYIIKNYFDNNAPLYKLAITSDKLEDKYYQKGVVVPLINGKIINLYEYFESHPENGLNIKNYVNYCMMNYNYTKVLRSEFLKNNQKIGEDLAFQILLSILRQDQNFHYENINLIEGKELKVAPPIDFEFSNFFLYPEVFIKYEKERLIYEKDVLIPSEFTKDDDLYYNICLELGTSPISYQKQNMFTIIELYPQVVSNFINSLERLIIDIDSIELSDEYDFIDKMNSDYWEVGNALYKLKDEEKSEYLKSVIPLFSIDKDKTFKRIKYDVREYAKKYLLTLKIYLLAYHKRINLEDLALNNINDEDIKKLIKS